MVMSLRAFFALSIPDGPAARLKAVQRGVAGAKWRPRENFHLTLRFLGDLTHDQAADLDELVGAQRGEPFELTLAGAGWFGGAEPRQLWIGVEENPPLHALARRLDAACRDLRLPPRSEKFWPHVTLAYCHGTSAGDAARFAERLALFRTDPFLVDEFALWSSHQAKYANRPNRYQEEANYPLI